MEERNKEGEIRRGVKGVRRRVVDLKGRGCGRAGKGVQWMKAAGIFEGERGRGEGGGAGRKPARARGQELEDIVLMVVRELLNW